MLKEKLKSSYPLLIFLAIGLISLGWFKGKQLISVDTLFPINIEVVNEYFGIWSEKVPGGTADVIKLPVLFPFAYLFKLYSTLKLPYNPKVAEMLLTYALFTFTGISTYILSKTSFPNLRKRVHIIAGLFYMFSVYTSFLFNAFPIFLIFSFAFFPLILAKFIKLLDTAKNQKIDLKHLLSESLVLGILSFFLLTTSYASTPYVLMHAGILATYLLFFLALNKGTRKRVVLASFAYLVVFATLSSYWIIPLLKVQTSIESLSENSLGSIDTFILNSTLPTEAVKMTGYFGFVDNYKGTPFNGWFSIYSGTFYKLLGYIPIFLAFAALLKKDIKMDYEKYIFFVLLALLLVIGLTLPYLPLLPVVEKLNPFLRIFELFRTAYQRFSPFLLMSLSVMVGFGINYLLQRFYKEHWLTPVLIGVILFLMVYNWPLITGKMFDKNEILPSKRVAIPTYYYQTDEWIKKNNDANSAILILPFNELSLASIWWNDGEDGYDGIHPFTHISQQRYMYGENFETLGSKLLLSDYTNTPEKTIADLSNLADIGFVIFHKDFNWKFLQNNSWWADTNPVIIYQKLKADTCLGSELEFGRLAVFRVIDSCRRSKMRAINLDDLTVGVTADSKAFKSYFLGLPNDLEIITSEDLDSVPIQNKTAVVVAELITNTVNAPLSGPTWWKTPYANISVLSPLHKMTLNREQKQLENAKNDTQKLQLLTTHYAKRAMELEKYNSPGAALVSKELLLKTLDQLEEIVHRNKNTDQNKAYKAQLPKTVGGIIASNRSIKNVSLGEILEGKISPIATNLFVDENICKVACFRMDIPKDATYYINPLPDFLNENVQVYMDGQQINPYSGIFLNKGSHILGFTLPTNILQEKTSEGLPAYIISDWRPRQLYKVSFDYKVLNSRFVVSIIEETFDAMSYENNDDIFYDPTSQRSVHPQSHLRQLPGLDKWATTSFTLRSRELTDVIAVMAFYKSEAFSQFEIRNFQIVEVPTNPITLTASPFISTPTSTDLDWKRINNHTFETTLKETKGPTLLVFGESFDEGWKLYKTDGKNNKGTIFERLGAKMLFKTTKNYLEEVKAPHVRVNSRSNGWILSPQSEKDLKLTLSFEPEKNLHLGAGISVVVLAVATSAVLVLNFKRRSNEK